MVNKEEGLTAKEAIDNLCGNCDGPTAGEKAVDTPMIGAAEANNRGVEAYSGGFTAIDAQYDERLWAVLHPGESALLDALIRGSWYAKGFTVPVSDPPQRVRVPRQFWDFLSLNFDEGTASGGRREYVGLRFYESGAPEPTSAAATASSVPEETDDVTDEITQPSIAAPVDA